MGVRSSSDDGMIADINVTPLVDVVLVLLIIFMITAPAIYQNALKVQLPKAGTGESTQRSPLQFVLSKAGELSMGKEKLEFSELSAKLKSLSEEAKKQPAMISADEGTPHGVVVKLMDLLRAEGLNQFALNVEPGGSVRK